MATDPLSGHFTAQPPPGTASPPAVPLQGPAKVEIYTLRFSPDCMRAKGLLDRKGVTYNEYLIDGDETARQAMIRRAQGRSTLPQIFVNNRGIGGCDELHAFEAEGRLDALLGLVT